ncbi:MAG: tol-pal system protein YbgF [Gammaproteobacteria bacterium]
MMKLRLLLLLLLSAWISFACAENDRRLPPVIDDSMYQTPAAQPTRIAGNDAMFELLARMDKLQNEVKVLRGQVEEQAHTIEELKRRQDNIYNDVDERLHKLETGSVGSASSSAIGDESASLYETTEPRIEESMGEMSEQQEYAAPGGYSDTMAEQPKSESAPAAPEESGNAGQEAAIPVPADEKQLYQSAYGALKSGQYDQAIVMLKKLASDYPSGEYADNAYYWLGETYKIKQDFDASRQAFSYLIENYPTSPKVPDALLKMGFLELEQNNRDKARELFNTVIDKYAGSSAANLAINKLKQMDRR